MSAVLYRMVPGFESHPYRERARIPNALISHIFYFLKALRLKTLKYTAKILSEATHLRMFEQLLHDLLMDTTSIKFYDEKNKRLMEECHNGYEKVKRLDRLLIDNAEVKLSSCVSKADDN
ncbi:unnamed protein product [Rhizopus stolonifer]